MLDKLKSLLTPKGEKATRIKAVEALQELTRLFTPLDHDVFVGRILNPRSVTIGSIAEKHGYAKPTVYKAQQLLRQKLDDLVDLVANEAEQIKAQFGLVTTKEQLEKALSEMTDSNDPLLISVLSVLVQKRLGCVLFKEHLFLNSELAELVSSAKKKAKPFTDRYNIVDEPQFRNSLMEPQWVDHFESIIEWSDLHRLFGVLCTRDNRVTQIRTAFLSFGCPVSSREIAQVCGASVSSVTTALSNMDDVGRATTTKWDLVKNISEPYRSVDQVLVDIIDSHEGQISKQDLIDTATSTYNVSEQSVLNVLKTKKFSVKKLSVTVNDPAHVRIAPLEDSIHGHTVDGLPYKVITVRPYQLTAKALYIPPSFAKHLGAEPESKMSVPIISPESVDNVQLTWSLSRINGTLLGSMGKVFKALNSQPGDQLKMVLHDDQQLSFESLADSDVPLNV